MSSRTKDAIVVAIITTLLAGCQGDAAPSEDWSFRGDAGGGGDDAEPLRDVDDDRPRRLQLLDLSDSTWHRYIETPWVPILKRQSFQAGGEVSRTRIVSAEGQDTMRTELSEGSWERVANGHLRIASPPDTADGEGETTETRMPRVGFRSAEIDGWFEVPEPEEGEQMRWLPGSYLADDHRQRRRFSGRFRVDFRAHSVPGHTLMESRVDIAFDRSLDAILQDGECRVIVDVTALGRWSDEEVCQVDHTIETSCNIVSKREGLEAITLGYGADPEKVAEKWGRVEAAPPDDGRSCETASEVLHGFFAPLLYRVESRPNVLFTAPVQQLARRWVRHRVE